MGKRRKKKTTNKNKKVKWYEMKNLFSLVPLYLIECI